MRRILILSVLTALAGLPRAGQYAAGGKLAGHRYGATLGYDPYESYINTWFSLITKPPRPIAAATETGFYTTLFLRSLTPYYILVQATDYPLTHATAAFHGSNPRAYERMRYVNGGFEIHPLEVLAAGYEEPYGISLFLGYITPFWETGADGSRHQAGSATAGFVGTRGDRSVRRMQSVNDTWYEIKWSLKGMRGTEAKYIKWNLQLGTKLHRNGDFLDAVFISLFRDFQDKKYRGWSLVRNAAAELRCEFPVDDIEAGAVSRYYARIGKKFPSRRWARVMYTLDTGLQWKRFGVPDADGALDETLEFFLRPNLLF